MPGAHSGQLEAGQCFGVQAALLFWGRGLLLGGPLLSQLSTWLSRCGRGGWRVPGSRRRHEPGRVPGARPAQNLGRRAVPGSDARGGAGPDWRSPRGRGWAGRPEAAAAAAPGAGAGAGSEAQRRRRRQQVPEASRAGTGADAVGPPVPGPAHGA